MSVVLSWQNTLWHALMRNGDIRSHAILLKGRKGIGKFSFARFFAKSLLCKNPLVDHRACGQCASCNWFEQHTHPNFVAVLPETMSSVETVSSSQITAVQSESEGHPSGDSPVKRKPSQHISISQIRALDDFVYLSGHQSGHKIVLIYPAETMNSAASNALLKKLEEPPEQVLFILVSHRSHRLLPTVRSRCQQIAMPVPDTETALAWLQQQIKVSSGQPPNGNTGVNQLRALLALSGYSPFEALVLAESNTQHRQFIDVIRNPDRFDPLAVAETQHNMDLIMTVEWLQKWCYDLLIFGAAGVIRYHPDCETHIRALCQRTAPQSVLAYLQFLNTRQALAYHPLQAKLFLEEILIHYAELFSPALSGLTRDAV
ncbi:MAG: DNA polymerase III subunit delta' [Nitrosomonas sp.]|nr:DNA polymerase III subunit delta' [Nitrosomonas sp.]